MNRFWHIALLATPLVTLGLTGCTDDPPTSPTPVTAGPCLDKETCTEALDHDPGGMEQGFTGSVRSSIPATRRDLSPSDSPGSAVSRDCVETRADRD